MNGTPFKNMNTITTDYLHNLKALLDGRRARNRNYSLRALARDLDVDNSYLAQILNGKKSMTPKIAYKLAIAMKLEGDDLLAFIRPSLQ